MIRSQLSGFSTYRYRRSATFSTISVPNLSRTSIRSRPTRRSRSWLEIQSKLTSRDTAVSALPTSAYSPDRKSPIAASMKAPVSSVSRAGVSPWNKYSNITATETPALHRTHSPTALKIEYLLPRLIIITPLYILITNKCSRIVHNIHQSIFSR